MKTLRDPALVGRDRRARRERCATTATFPNVRHGRPGGPSLPLAIFFAAVLSANAQPVTIGSKKFTESYVLGEIAKRELTFGRRCVVAKSMPTPSIPERSHKRF